MKILSVVQDVGLFPTPKGPLKSVAFIQVDHSITRNTRGGAESGIIQCLKSKAMKLWTQHKPDFAIESTPVDHTQSDYYKNKDLPNIKSGYDRLFEHLGTKLFIWCSLKKPHHESDKILYELEVPEKEIISFIVECTWHKLITNCRTFPNDDCRVSLWKRERDTSDHDAYKKQQNEKCYSPESEEQLWNRLFLLNPSNISLPACPAGIQIPALQKLQMCSALIKSPINKEWIIGKLNPYLMSVVQL